MGTALSSFPFRHSAFRVVAPGTGLFLQDLCVLFKTQSESRSVPMAHVFLYGTLKRGQPNHKVMLDGANGSAAFCARGRTLQPYPLVIAGQYNIPRLLNLPGTGRCVEGEIYTVDEQMLRFLDDFEGCPDVYQRTTVAVRVLRDLGEGRPEDTLAADSTVQCFVYSTATHPPEWVHLPFHDCYDSEGQHGLRYTPREDR
nr:gamma-glutamylaminecyclotransferase isoform X1 [Microcebus murinus]XP_012607314.1 gamma-glutamylaminecyclotransferase isoform X1 [Microcebus murinus]XP_012607315.1 gamma-glutamylaminecyclotransferase isoform X1 [Microcebus murinus]XP_012607316.1 gamma-glutamylaminecyclotransferase isoform X1 [Microcebus murinus]XP_020145847.1 gamma-glutamylaminecyclotransferase isoform X1 [Microcebus murinus]